VVQRQLPAMEGEQSGQAVNCWSHEAPIPGKSPAESTASVQDSPPEASRSEPTGTRDCQRTTDRVTIARVVSLSLSRLDLSLAPASGSFGFRLRNCAASTPFTPNSVGVVNDPLTIIRPSARQLDPHG
jgi:hypothetical protein